MARIIRVFGQQHALQLCFQGQEGGLGVADFFLRHGLNIRVRVQQHGLGGGAVLLVLQPFLIGRDQCHHLGVFTRQDQELCHVLHDVFAG